jgi:TRAP-type uncharacterized transport system fused permease subunit
MRGEIVFWIFEAILLGGAAALAYSLYRSIKDRGVKLWPLLPWVVVAIAMVIFFNIQQAPR